jgi:lipid-binding SYLF domain-containing protein
MQKLLTAAAAAICLLTFLPAQPRAQKDDKDNETKRVSEATAIFGEIMAAEDKAIPNAILQKAAGIAIFPNTIKAGLVVGGVRGRGIISAHGANGWSSPAFLTLIGGSFGLQIGGQSADIILVINNERGLENLVSNQFKIGADASIAAGPVGRDAQAATDLQLRAQILSYSRARGLFAGVTINGSTIRQDVDANERFYGSRLTTRQNRVRRKSRRTGTCRAVARRAREVRAVALTVDLLQCRFEVGVSELESAPFGLGRKDAATIEDHRVRHFTEHQS